VLAITGGLVNPPAVAVTVTVTVAPFDKTGLNGPVAVALKFPEVSVRVRGIGPPVIVVDRTCGGWEQTMKDTKTKERSRDDEAHDRDT
jgi:hypothetical protein